MKNKSFNLGPSDKDKNPGCLTLRPSDESMNPDFLDLDRKRDVEGIIG